VAEVRGRQEEQVVAEGLEGRHGGPVAVPLQRVAAVDEAGLAVGLVLRGTGREAAREEALPPVAERDGLGAVQDAFGGEEVLRSIRSPPKLCRKGEKA
jgi:hypothetical protein